jgi:glycosyltransferase involved in cell wall biosynthesis
MNGDASAASARWFTCTPVAFGGGADFFARDSGLLCRGFQNLGIESNAVMPGEPQEGDEPDLIRTPYENIESANWWKSHNLDGVVLYAWGRPCFRKVARAIHEAGVFLILNQDNGGLVSPLAGPGEWWDEQAILTGYASDPRALPAFLTRIVRGLTLGLAVTDPLRALHLHQGDVIACVSPAAAEFYRQLCFFYGGRSLARRVQVFPHPVEPIFRYESEIKRRQIVCVGRWNDALQKRPSRLMQVVKILLDKDPNIAIVIAGNPTDEMIAWYAALPENHASRVELASLLDRATLMKIMRKSQVFYSPSSYESFGIAAAEALCSGCSVVAGKSISMVSFEWFVSEQSGCLADQDTPQAHADLIFTELKRWEDGERNADRISSIWQKRLHAHNVAAAMINLSP